MTFVNWQLCKTSNFRELNTPITDNVQVSRHRLTDITRYLLWRRQWYEFRPITPQRSCVYNTAELLQITITIKIILMHHKVTNYWNTYEITTIDKVVSCKIYLITEAAEVTFFPVLRLMYLFFVVVPNNLVWSGENGDSNVFHLSRFTDWPPYCYTIRNVIGLCDWQINAHAVLFCKYAETELDSTKKNLPGLIIGTLA